MTLVSSLVRRFQPQVMYAFAQRTPKGSFQIKILPALRDVGSADPITAATALNSGVEQCVRLCPEQYMWSYRRFRTRPPDELAARGPS
jgi:KDO2-lipid IV(A) lauroyltransferase